MKDKSTEQRLKEGHYKLSMMQGSAVNDAHRARNAIKARREELAGYEKELVAAEKEVALKSAIVFDEVCEAHGIVRAGRAVVASKDLTTFTLGEIENGEAWTESKDTERKPLILDAHGHAANTGSERRSGGIVQSIRPSEPGVITPEDAASIIEAAEAQR